MELEQDVRSGSVHASKKQGIKDFFFKKTYAGTQAGELKPTGCKGKIQNKSEREA
jgi:hypothetical protein